MRVFTCCAFQLPLPFLLATSGSYYTLLLVLLLLWLPFFSFLSTCVYIVLPISTLFLFGLLIPHKFLIRQKCIYIYVSVCARHMHTNTLLLLAKPVNIQLLMLYYTKLWTQCTSERARVYIYKHTYVKYVCRKCVIFVWNSNNKDRKNILNCQCIRFVIISSFFIRCLCLGEWVCANEMNEVDWLVARCCKVSSYLQ